MGTARSEKLPVRSCSEGIESSARLAPPRDRNQSTLAKKYVLCFDPQINGSGLIITGPPIMKPGSFSLSLGRASPAGRLLVDCAAFRLLFRRYTKPPPWN